MELWEAHHLYAMYIRSELNQEESIHLHWKLRANLQTPRFQGNTMTINGVSVSTVV